MSSATVAEVPPTTALRAAHNAAAMPELAGTVETATAGESGAAAASKESTELSERTFLGVVKSYNDRRGFGFVACPEMVAQHGRDVYLPKTEAALAAATGPVTENMAEDDVLEFRVRLSVEGYPQAGDARRLKKFRGTVVRPPRSAGAGGPALAGLLCSREMEEALGTESAAVGAETLGQLRLVEGDEVSFCVPRAREGEPVEAQLVCLEQTARPAAAVLGLFSARLPRDRQRPDLALHCHAFADKVVVTGLPADATEAELFHFFSKQGATKVALAWAAGGAGYAAAQFPGVGAVSRLLSSGVHAFADEAETRVATLLPGAPAAEQPPLPALPRPCLTPGQEPGAMLITWSPSVIAAEYMLEMRPAGVQAPWRPVEELTGRAQRSECSSCRVTGLPTSTALEARVSFATTCGTRSEVSDPSEPCAAVPPPAPKPEDPPVTIPAAAFPSQLASGPSHAVAAPAPLPPAAPPCAPTLGWQCVHGGLVPAPPAPEVLWADEVGSSVLVRWFPVPHAAAYVVELSEAGGSACERFVRGAEGTALGCPVDLQVGGLRRLAPGGCYLAQVRCVSTFGGESAPSAPGWTTPAGWALAPASAAGPGTAVLPRLLRSPGHPLVPAPAGPPVGLHEAAKPGPVPIAPAPIVPDNLQAAVPFGGGFQPTGGLVVQGAPAGASSNFSLMLD
mmetsp:Transcript_95937/g.260444  ORF Transcript_95937/g.260444 Transcript_95937/m.260444 type:complete len:679 (-) Transcript_95937:253-2289(-)